MWGASQDRGYVCVGGEGAGRGGGHTYKHTRQYAYIKAHTHTDRRILYTQYVLVSNI
jgi:hypothetical protein